MDITLKILNLDLDYDITSGGNGPGNTGTQYCLVKMTLNEWEEVCVCRRRWVFLCENEFHTHCLFAHGAQ